MTYIVDADTKKIVKGLVHSERERASRKREAHQTDFDKRVEEAIRKAQADMVIVNCCAGTRIAIIQKLHQSLTDNRPWEAMGDTLCGRRLFYTYRKQYMWRIAKNIGIIVGNK